MLFSVQKKQIPNFCVVANNISPEINNVSVVYRYVGKQVTGKNCKRTIRYQCPTPPVPATYADVKLPEMYTTTTNNQQFLQYDNGQNAENRMLVFYSPDKLERLANVQTFFMDGTFSVAPHPCKQLYTIQSIVDNCHASNLQLNVQTIITDIEDAVLRVVTAVFGRHINHQSCFYHLTQASWRKIQQLGLMSLYNNDDDFRLLCGMMEGLAFLPVPDLTNGIHLLRTLCPDDPPEEAELLYYFDSTYVSGRLRQQNPAQNQAVHMGLRRSPPMFPPAIWNVHDATVNGDARTNNMCEGWNNKFFNLVGHAHSSICRVIEWCQKEEAVGYPPVKRTQQKHVQLQERLQNLCRNPTTGQKTIAEFLCGVGWNIRLNHQH